MNYRMKLNGAFPNPAARPASPGNRSVGRTGGARRAGVGAASPRTRTRVGPISTPFPPPAPNLFEEFCGGGDEGVGLLDPGFDDFDIDLRILLGITEYDGTGSEDL